MKKKEESLYDLCWIYVFISDSMECLKEEKKRKTDFCYIPLHIYDMPDDSKKKILKQSEEALETIKQRIRKLVK